jgi:phage terminase small subunit|tara:strand:+ start:2569 stop:2802 length:234 start_codon:yes stop_codon:yes gene_type:complete
MYIDDTAKEKFSNKVIDRAMSTKLSFMDCVLELSSEMGLDPSAAGKLLTKPIIEKIQIEAQELHFMKKTKSRKLPID